MVPPDVLGATEVKRGFPAARSAGRREEETEDA